MSMPLKWSSTIASGVDLLISERMQYVYALKMVINDSIWSGFADKQYDVPLLYYGDTCCYVVNPTEKFLAMYPSVLIHSDNNIQIYQTEKVDDKPFHMHVTFTDEESNIDYRTPFMRCSSLEQTSKTIPDVTSVSRRVRLFQMSLQSTNGPRW